MRENLPKEMDFQHEAWNAERTVENFRNIRTALYIRMHVPFLVVGCLVNAERYSCLASH